MSSAPFGTKTVRGFELRQDPAREECFEVVNTDAEMAEWPDMSELARRERLHRHMNNEAGAMEIAAVCLVDYPETAWELRSRLARQTADEARHADLLLRRLKELGGHKGEFPVANYEWGVTCMLDDLPGRLAVQNRTFEAGLIDLLGTLRDVWRKAGDETTAEILDGILADEIIHVRFANRWIRRMTEDDPRILLKVAKAVRFLGQANDACQIREEGEVNIVGTRLTTKAPPKVYEQGRREAEFTEEEILEVLKQAAFRSIIPQDQRSTQAK